jgi:ribulose-5-phosphate 4-epimerase/fuculose-1-phosphate aldolase
VSLRAEVVAVGRELLARGLVAGTSGNVSARDGERVLITPAAVPYPEIGEADLVELGLDGTVHGGSRPPSSERRVHLAIYAARPDVGAIVHSHSVHATAWSALREPLDTGGEEIEMVCGGAVRCAPFAPTGGEEIAVAAVDALAGRRAALMERHGVVATGATPSEALEVATIVERQAQIAWLLRRA